MKVIKENPKGVNDSETDRTERIEQRNAEFDNSETLDGTVVDLELDYPDFDIFDYVNPALNAALEAEIAKISLNAIHCDQPDLNSNRLAPENSVDEPTIPKQFDPGFEQLQQLSVLELQSFRRKIQQQMELVSNLLKHLNNPTTIQQKQVDHASTVEIGTRIQPKNGEDGIVLAQQLAPSSDSHDNSNARELEIVQQAHVEQCNRMSCIESHDKASSDSDSEHNQLVDAPSYSRRTLQANVCNDTGEVSLEGENKEIVNLASTVEMSTRMQQPTNAEVGIVANNNLATLSDNNGQSNAQEVESMQQAQCNRKSITNRFDDNVSSDTALHHQLEEASPHPSGTVREDNSNETGKGPLRMKKKVRVNGGKRVQFLKNPNCSDKDAPTFPKTYSCGECNKRFSRKGHLAIHFRIHSGEKPYKCEVCNNSFRQNSNLITHLRSHIGEKPYKCEICNKFFTLKQNLSRHLMIHTHEKPFECDICKRKFRRKSHLADHMNIHSALQRCKME